jgi:cysteine desulfurase/selenocysteine lyase
MPLDTSSIRNDFPILSREIRPGIQLVYLDSTATTQKPLSVLKAINDFYRYNNANIHRGVHTLAEEATAMYEHARQGVAKFIHASSSNEIVFTRNATEAINLVAYSWARTNLRTGDLVLLTEMEHHSNLVPWYQLAMERNIKLEYIPVTEEGLLDLDVFRLLLERNPKLVSFSAMSNVIGTINPTHEMVKMAHKAGSLVLVDGAQSVPHLPVDVQALDLDFLAFSAHKMLGPTGIGVLYGKANLLEVMPPFLGFAAAIEYLTGIGMDSVQKHEQGMSKYAMQKLEEIPGIRILGPVAEKRAGVVSFTLEGIHPHDVAQILDHYGVAVRAGHHCAQPLHERYGVVATTRASFYLYNEKNEVDKLVNGIHQVKKIFN